MSYRSSSSMIAAIVAAALLGDAKGAVNPTDKCLSLKLIAAGKYSLCRMKAEAKAVKMELPADFTKCDEKFNDKWTKIETAAEGACPSTGDGASIQAAVTSDAALLAGLIGTVCQGVLVGDGCWYLGAAGESCDTVCAIHAGYNALTETFAGSGGTLANCASVLVALGVSVPVTEALSCVSGGVGCTQSVFGGAARCVTPTTTSSAAGPNAIRVCACNG